MKDRRRANGFKISDAEARLLEFAAVSEYAWRQVPERAERAIHQKRIFNRRTLARLAGSHLIKYRPAQIYCTRLGREALRRYRKNGGTDGQNNA